MANFDWMRGMIMDGLHQSLSLLQMTCCCYDSHNLNNEGGYFGSNGLHAMLGSGLKSVLVTLKTCVTQHNKGIIATDERINRYTQGYRPRKLTSKKEVPNKSVHQFFFKIHTWSFCVLCARVSSENWSKDCFTHALQHILIVVWQWAQKSSLPWTVNYYHVFLYFGRFLQIYNHYTFA